MQCADRIRHKSIQAASLASLPSIIVTFGGSTVPLAVLAVPFQNGWGYHFLPVILIIPRSIATGQALAADSHPGRGFFMKHYP